MVTPTSIYHIEYQLVVVSNEYVSASSFLTLYSENIEECDKQDIVTNIGFEAIVPSILKVLLSLAHG